MRLANSAWLLATRRTRCICRLSPSYLAVPLRLASAERRSGTQTYRQQQAFAVFTLNLGDLNRTVCLGNQRTPAKNHPIRREMRRSYCVRVFGEQTVAIG